MLFVPSQSPKTTNDRSLKFEITLAPLFNTDIFIRRILGVGSLPVSWGSDEETTLVQGGQVQHTEAQIGPEKGLLVPEQALLDVLVGRQERGLLDVPPVCTVHHVVSGTAREVGLTLYYTPHVNIQHAVFPQDFQMTNQR